jgi:signal transduction histidine kinase
LRRPDLPEEERTRHLDSLSKGLRRIARTVEQLLGFARPFQTHRGPTALEDVVARAVRLLEPSLPEERITIELVFKPGFPRSRSIATRSSGRWSTRC